MSDKSKTETRREFIASTGRFVLLGMLALITGTIFAKKRCLLGMGGTCGSCADLFSCAKPAAKAARNAAAGATVWQLDPAKCIQCGRCATKCVINPSAVKCVHTFKMCGYCKLCFGFFEPGAKELTSAAENQVCPLGAIKRKYVEEPYFEYTIDETLCNGCGKCVKGCGSFGNGSLFLQVRHDVCLNCNECAIARNCPAQAFRRVPAAKPYIMRGEKAEA